MRKAKKTDTVRVHYTGMLPDGDIFDSSLSRDPLEFTLGDGSLIKGFEEGVIGMKVNESKRVEIPAAEAYGASNPDLVFEVNRGDLPQELDPQVGMQLNSQTPEGTHFQVKVVGITDAIIKVDANHPLAGKDLVFDITLVEFV